MSCIRNKSFIKNYKLRIHRKLKEILDETECVKNLLVVELAKIQQKDEAVQQNNSDSFFDVYEEVNEDLDKFSEKLFLINNILCAEASDDVAEDDVKQDFVTDPPPNTDCKSSERLPHYFNGSSTHEDDVKSNHFQDFVTDPPPKTDCKSSERLPHYFSRSSTHEDDVKSNHSKSALKESRGSNSIRNETSSNQNAYESDCDNTLDSNKKGFNDDESRRLLNAEKFTGSSSIIRESDRVVNKDDKTNSDIDRSQIVQRDEKVTNPSIEQLTAFDSSFSQDSYFYSVSSRSKDSLYSCSIDNENHIPNTYESSVYKSLESVNDRTLQYDKRPTNVIEFEIASPQVGIGSCIDAILSEFHSPSDFWLHLLCFENYSIETLDFGTLPRLNRSLVRIHQYCLAPLQECHIVSEGAYRRAKIIKLLPASADVVLFFIDYGCKRTVSVRDLIEMPLSLFSTPACAVRCCLSGVLHEGHVWNSMAKEMFLKMFDSDPKVFAVAEEKGKFVVEIKTVNFDGAETDLTEYMLLMGLASSVSPSNHIENSLLKNMDYCNQEYSGNCNQSNSTVLYEHGGESIDVNSLQSKDLTYCLGINQNDVNENNESILYDSGYPTTDTNDFQQQDLAYCKQTNYDIIIRKNTKELYDSRCSTMAADDFQLKNLNYCQGKIRDDVNEKQIYDSKCLTTDIDDFQLESLDYDKSSSHNDVNGNSKAVLYDSGYVTVDINNTEKEDFSSEETVDLSNLKILSKKGRNLSDNDRNCKEKLEEMTESPFANDESPKEIEDFDWNVQIPPPQLPYIRDNLLLVMAAIIYSPFEFYVNPVCDSSADFDSLQEQMNCFYKQKELKELAIKAEHLKVGCFCCLQNSIDKQWLRVQVLEVNRSGNEKPKAFIQCVDYGDSYAVDVESLRPLAKRFAKYPAFAILCSLAHIRPKGSSEDSSKEWGESTVEKLTSLVGNEKFFTAQIIGSKTLLDGRTTLDVLLWDSEPTDILVNDILVNEGLAELSPEMSERTQKVHQDDHSLDNWNPIAEDYYRVENSYAVDVSDPDMAIVGYKPKDEQYICKHYEMYGTCNFDHCSFQHVTTSHDGVTLDRDEVCVVENPVVLPDPDTYVIGQVSTVINPDHFFLVFPYGTTSVRNIHYLGPKKKGPHVEMEALLEAMNSYYSTAPFKELTTVALAYGTIVVAKSEISDTWLRARITEVDDVDKPVKVFFVDLGSVEWVRREHVQEIKQEFTLTPFQAVECFLCGVEPRNYENTEKWSNKSKLFFKQLVEGKILIVHVEKKIGNVLYVDLLISECDGWIKVTDLLVEQGFACRKPNFLNDCTEIKNNTLQNGDDSHCENNSNTVEKKIAGCDFTSPGQPG